MTMPLIDLVAQGYTIRGEIGEAIHGVLESSTLVFDPDATAFEARGRASCTSNTVDSLSPCGR